MTRPPTEVGPKRSPALRGSVRLRITHTRQTRTDNIGERPRALLSRGLMTGKRSVLLSLEPIMRPRLYNIAHRIAWPGIMPRDCGSRRYRIPVSTADAILRVFRPM